MAPDLTGAEVNRRIKNLQLYIRLLCELGVWNQQLSTA
jgi:hypothetical protein